MRMSVELEGFAPTKKRLKRLPREAKEHLLVIADVIMEHATIRARLNAPILTEALRNHIRYEEPIIQGGSVLTGIGVTDDPRVYGLRWHEEEFKLGPVSAKQPSTVEGGVGNKYITRVFDYWGKTYVSLMSEGLQQSFDKGKSVKPSPPSRRRS